MVLKPFKRVSVSQVETFNDCQRKWWFGKILGLPQVDKDSTFFGTAYHAVTERYRLAGDTGRGPDGSPVDLYPPGWENVYVEEFRNGVLVQTDVVAHRLTAQEQDLVRRLVEHGIESGALERRPGRKVEQEFRLDVVDGIQSVGFIDVFVPPNEIHDDKTIKSKRWAKGKARRAVDVQLLHYAYTRIAELRRRGEEPPASFILRHNQFFKDTGESRSAQVEVSRAHVEEAFARFVATVQRMREAALKTRPEDLPDPAPNTCRKYGGCPFVPICGRMESIETYVARVNRTNAVRLAKLNPGKAIGGTPMAGLLDRLPKNGTATVAAGAAKTATPPKQAAPAVNPPPPTRASGPSLMERMRAGAPAPTAAAAAPPPAKAPPAAPAAPAAPAPPARPVFDPAAYAETGAPPWADPACQACAGSKHPGFNTQGSPCRICAGRAPAAGRPLPAAFILAPWTWVAPAEAAQPAEVTEEAAAPPPAEVAQEAAFEVQEAPAASEEPATEPEVTEDAPATAPAGKGGRSPGRPAATFTLLIGCAPLRPARGEVLIEDLFGELAGKLAEHEKAPNYFALDPFRRRDMMVQAVSRIVIDQKGRTLVCSTARPSPDMAAFVEALKAHATTVIVSTGS